MFKCSTQLLVTVVGCIILMTKYGSTDSDKSWKRGKRQQVGSSCNENIDCLTSTGGAYCDSTKVCVCLPTSVNIGGFCWPKINPGQTGCQYSAQCEGVWPGATCDSTSTCRCSNNQPPATTNDGTVCINAGACPTNGPNSMYKDSSGKIIPCDNVVACDTIVNEYDCICSPPATSTVIGALCPGMSYCCPSRALACIMPQDSGTFSGGLAQQKVWYNSATNNCEQFTYNGRGGNANNFDSIAQCESYCKTACPRGRPSYSANDIPNTLPTRQAIITCTSTTTTTCDSNHYCNTASTSLSSYCCPTPAFICTNNGGIVNVGAPITFPEPGSIAPDVSVRTRYYYDSASSTCLPFQYNGQGGTYNNFATMAECQSYCARSVCAAGDPLRDVNQITTLRCGTGGTSVCPARYDCSTTGYCCPSRDFVCNQPAAPGSCLSSVQRWFYDRNARTCTQFTYNGCQGNFNNFNSYTDCTNFCGSTSVGARCPQGNAARDTNGAYTVCSGTSTSVTQCTSGYFCYYDGNVYGCCPTQSQTCSVETSDSGTPCVTPVTRWYLNTLTNRCATFTYNGCDGNSNNFATQIDCQQYCNVGGCPDGSEPYRDTTGGNYRVCTTTGQECPVGYSCSRVNLGTTTTVSNYCCPSRDTVCRMAQDPGTFCGSTTITRYSFNPSTRNCESFTYRGCNGNRNNFATSAQCFTYCNSAACPSGQIAMQDPTSRQLTSCTVGGTGCPSGYTCVQSALLNQGVCCGSNAPPGTCPAGQLAYMDSLTNGPLQCRQNIDGQCQTGYFCQFSPTQSNSFCCGSAVIQCPSGGNVNINTAGQAQQCTPNVPQNCPTGYACQPTTVLVGTIQSATGYCCGTPNPCGQGFNTQFTNNQPATCVLNAAQTTCTSPYTCQQTTSGQAYCCVQAAVNVAVCATGKSPLMILNSPTICTSNGGAGTGCPAGYTCDLYTAVNSFYCCTASTTVPPTTQRCPTNFNVLQPEQTCGTSPDTCPSAQGAFCSYDRTTNRYICCTSGVTQPPATNPCPSPATAQLGANGQPVQCLGAVTCGANYVCRYSNTQLGYYCCSRIGNNGCATGNPYLYPGTNLPLACTATGPACPTGYRCIASTITTGSQCCSNTAAVATTQTLGSVTTITCTGDAYCKTRLNTRAFCNTSNNTYKCQCGPTDTFSNGSCVTPPGK